MLRSLFASAAILTFAAGLAIAQEESTTTSHSSSSTTSSGSSGSSMPSKHHKKGVETIQTLVNLALMRGNIGRPGAGICPVRGHSNVQGQRTVGISEKTKLVPLDKLAELYGFEPPRWDGLTTVDACKGMIKGEVRGFVGLGGNFLRAIPERSDQPEAVAATNAGGPRRRRPKTSSRPSDAERAARWQTECTVRLGARHECGK